MATSSFKKNFAVSKKNINKFVNKMSENVKPTIKKDFNSKYTTIEDLKNQKGSR
ncbi:hypothetical protein HZY83_07295 [Gemella sp. GH3]|uniref:hypothetical protein n=1 Tax=unclassified Gemella TaxID=2624949 RepID=UPI0015D025F0|nr:MULTISPECIES: hypothetical protein [unclassified Gemella]MBF0714478.1 hypothetical protein [Gemella sp. GH3.1]NYS51430.1 hypothetical protein [Gemella sp. GH3]